MLKFEGVKKHYEDFELDLTLEVPEGYVTGLIGANGAEKSTKTHAGKSVQLDFYGCGDLHADFNCDHDSTSVFHQHLCVCGDRGGHSACVWRWISL